MKKCGSHSRVTKVPGPSLLCLTCFKLKLHCILQPKLISTPHMAHDKVWCNPKFRRYNCTILFRSWQVAPCYDKIRLFNYHDMAIDLSYLMPYNLIYNLLNFRFWLLKMEEQRPLLRTARHSQSVRRASSHRSMQIACVCVLITVVLERIAFYGVVGRHTHF